MRASRMKALAGGTLSGCISAEFESDNSLHANSGAAAQWLATRRKSASPPTAVSAVKPPAEKPNMPMRSALIRAWPGQAFDM
jgi:hypothetical protein